MIIIPAICPVIIYPIVVCIVAADHYFFFKVLI
jgi:hypothetical protein